MENTHLELLKEKAKTASLNAYSPYSKFKVGAAVEDQEGNIFTGCNIENLAFPSGICAERTAIFKAVSEMGPSMKIKTVAVYTSTPDVTTPCGGCRQVINEFADENARIISFCDTDRMMSVAFRELLPSPTAIDL